VKKANRPPKFTKHEVREAAVILGTSSWQTLSEKLSPDELRKRQSKAGSLGGRPRLQG
jgi:hypothetical protein